MKKGQLCIGKVIDVTFPNKGKVMIEEIEGDATALGVGEVATVKNCLPGQKRI